MEKTKHGWEDIKFPIVRNVQAKTLGDQIDGMTAPECAEAMGKMFGDINLKMMELAYLDKIVTDNKGEYYSIFRDNTRIIVEEEWIFNGCKNDDDACDYAREVGEELIEKYPLLEIAEIFAHRHKYAIVELRIKPEEI